jgi:flagellar biosynthesis protein FlhF
MKIKRFFAPDIRQAMRMVRDEQGPDAVILSNKRVDGGVEIVAAIDYDERALSPAALAQAQAQVQAQTQAQPRTQAASIAPRAEAPLVRDSLPPSARPQESVSAPEPAPVRERLWSGEPTLLEMKNELHTLRRMLEGQLSGLAWGAFVRGEPRRVELIERLLRFGMSAAQSRSIVEAVMNDEADVETGWHRALDMIARGVPLYRRDPMADGGTIALVGPTGAGKTTTAAKLAANYALRHGQRQVAMISMDSYRIGGWEQLRAYGRLLDVPVRTADTREELQQALDEFSDRSLVLIDTGGVNQRDGGLERQIGILDKSALRAEVMLLLPANCRQSGLGEVIDAFSAFAPDAGIVTKVDETTCLGGVLSAAATHQLPLAWISDGQRVPEDLHPAQASDLVARATHIMNRTGPRIDEDLVSLSFGREIATAHH